jgi:hypothetical protein
VSLDGLAVAPEMPTLTGVAVAESKTEPWLDGFQEHVATIFGELPLVALLLQPGKTRPLMVKVTLEATLTFAVISMALLNVAVVTDPASASELNEDVSTTSVTEIVIV